MSVASYPLSQLNMDDIENFEPDSAGALDLKYQGLTEFDPLVFSCTNLLCLDVSFNLLTSIPDELSSLQHLQEIHCGSNKIATIPESIGSMSSLRVIEAQSNMLMGLPQSIGHLKCLERLNLADNVLTSLPHEIGHCHSLQSLILKNNALSRLPLSLASLKDTLLDLDVSNNDEQMQVALPSQIHCDASSVLWILSLQREKTHCIESLKNEVRVSQHQTHESTEALTQARIEMEELETKKLNLEEEMESVRYFLTVRRYYRESRRKLTELWQNLRRACMKRYQSQITSDQGSV